MAGKKDLPAGAPADDTARAANADPTDPAEAVPDACATDLAERNRARAYAEIAAGDTASQPGAL